MRVLNEKWLIICKPSCSRIFRLVV